MEFFLGIYLIYGLTVLSNAFYMMLNEHPVEQKYLLVVFIPVINTIFLICVLLKQIVIVLKSLMTINMKNIFHKNILKNIKDAFKEI